MAHWRDEFLAALTVRDQREKANAALYDACPFYRRSLLTTTDIILPI
jgi:hypothetical protein